MTTGTIPPIWPDLHDTSAGHCPDCGCSLRVAQFIRASDPQRTVVVYDRCPNANFHATEAP